MTLARLAVCTLAALIPGCDFDRYCEGDWAAVPPEPAPAAREARVVAQVLPVESTAVDILFVIDNSRSMKDQQEQLGIWSSELFDVLSGTGELPDLHIGVTSSSVAIPNLEGCKVAASGRLVVGTAEVEGSFLIDVAGPEGRQRNYRGSLTEAFANMARLGDTGCGYEQSFEAARLALGTPGFLREDALLLVVFVTDEDDCSATTPALFSEPLADACSELGALTSYRCFEHGVVCADGKGSRELGPRTGCRPDEQSPYVVSVAGFAQYLKRLKTYPAQTLVAAIYGKPNSVFAIPDERVTSFPTPRLGDVCGGHGPAGNGATPGIRINALLSEFGGRASQSSICEPELSWAMRDVGLVTRGAATRSRCLRGALIDVDPVLPGIQPRCRVEAVAAPGTSRELHRELAFSLEQDLACPGTELAFRVDGEVERDRTVVVRCEVASDGGPASR